VAGRERARRALRLLVGIGILVEVVRRLGMGFIASRDELAAEKAAEQAAPDDTGTR
jgi:hypothetical protein